MIQPYQIPHGFTELSDVWNNVFKLYFNSRSRDTKPFCTISLIHLNHRTNSVNYGVHNSNYCFGPSFSLSPTPTHTQTFSGTSQTAFNPTVLSQRCFRVAAHLETETNRFSFCACEKSLRIVHQAVWPPDET